MHRIYELHLHGDREAGVAPQLPARALRLAQLWLRDLTYQKMFAYFERHRALQTTQHESTATRMPLDLIAHGRELAEEGIETDPQARPYAAPRYWAAFAFYGAIEE